MGEIPALCGELVDVGGHRLCARIEGGGAPMVVFENGGGSPSLVWEYVRSQMGEFTATLTYDRAGIGWSELPAGSRDADAVAGDLRALLDAVSAPRPYLVVGHSIGGLFAVRFAQLNPEAVAGLVLVDGAHPDVYDEIDAALPPHLRLLQRATRPAMALGDALGVVGFAAQRLPSQPPLGHSARPGYDEARRAFWSGQSRLRGSAAEGRALKRTCRVVRSGGTLGDLPLVVVSAGQARGGFRPVWPIWQVAQRRLLELSSRSEQIIAERSGHFVQQQEPDVVVEAVRRVLTQIEEGSGGAPRG